MLSEAEAWRYVEALWRNPVEGFLAWQSSEGDLGVCSCIYNRQEEGDITQDTADLMYTKVAEEKKRLGREPNTYGWSHTYEGAIQRADFCRRMAEELERGAAC